jgi:hypothetical protein
MHVIPLLRRPAQRLIMPDWLAITIGRHIFAWRELNAVELAHEVKHVEQWRRHGILFVPLYLRSSYRAQRAGLDRYRDNEFEREAFEAERLARALLAGAAAPG